MRGLGEAPGFTQLPWVVEQCREQLGFEPYPGTLNLEVLPEDLALWQELRSRQDAVLSPPDGAFCDASCQLVSVAGQIRAATVVPHVPDYPADKLELLAPVSVMATLGLELGQVVAIEA